MPRDRGPAFCIASPSGKHTAKPQGWHAGYCEWCSEELERRGDALVSLDYRVPVQPPPTPEYQADGDVRELAS